MIKKLFNFFKRKETSKLDTSYKLIKSHLVLTYSRHYDIIFILNDATYKPIHFCTDEFYQSNYDLPLYIRYLYTIGQLNRIKLIKINPKDDYYDFSYCSEEEQKNFLAKIVQGELTSG